MRRNIFAASAVLLWGTALTATAVAQQPVKLGVLNDQTGLYSDLSGMGSVHASRMAVEDFGGKVLGRPIEVIFADHQNKPDIGANIARQWIETEGVNLILDIPNSAVGLAVRVTSRTASPTAELGMSRMAVTPWVSIHCRARLAPMSGLFWWSAKMTSIGRPSTLPP